MNQAESNNEVKVYEIGYLVLPSVSEDQLPSVVGKIRGAVEKSGGKVFDGEEPMKIDLAYTMSKVVGASRYVASDAYLGWLKFELEAAQALAVKASLDEISELLRYLLIKAPRESDFTFEKARQAELQRMAKDSEGAESPAEGEAAAPAEAVVE